MTYERCLQCTWYDFNTQKCSRILKGKLLIAHGGGELTIETQPGLIPEHLQDELEAWLIDAITTAVDSYPGWTEILQLRKTNGGCAANVESTAIKLFGKKLSLVKPIADPQPDKNLDAHGLFKSDISLW